MVRALVSALLYILANAVGLLLAMAFLPGFRIDAFSFVIATLVFTAVEVVMGPLLTKMSIKSVPALSGSVALVTTFIGLFVTSMLLDGMEVGGIANWLAATLLIWVGALIAGLILPAVMFKKVLQRK
jgi:uncharacterized membrane protein YvlD (DUF360 family)